VRRGVVPQSSWAATALAETHRVFPVDDLTDTSIAFAVLNGTRFEGTALTRADLSGVAARRTCFAGVDFSTAVVDGATFMPSFGSVTDAAGNATAAFVLVHDSDAQRISETRDADERSLKPSNEMARFSPADSVIVSAFQGDVRLWRASTGGLLFKLSGGHTQTAPASDKASPSRRGHDARSDTTHVSHAAFTPDEAVVVTGDSAGVLCVWRVGDGSLLRSLTGRGKVQSLSVTTDGALVVAEFLERVWQHTDRTARPSREDVDGSDSGRSSARDSSDTGCSGSDSDDEPWGRTERAPHGTEQCMTTVQRRWWLATGVEDTRPVAGVNLAMVLPAEPRGRGKFSRDGQRELTNFFNRVLVHDHGGDQQQQRRYAFEGAVPAARPEDDASTKRPLFFGVDSNTVIAGTAVSPGGETVVLCGWEESSLAAGVDRVVGFADEHSVATGRRLRSFVFATHDGRDARHAAPTCAAFSRDGTALVVGDGAGALRMWCVATGALTARQPPPAASDARAALFVGFRDASNAVVRVQFKPRFVAGKPAKPHAAVWDANERTLQIDSAVGESTAERHAYSADGRFVALTSDASKRMQLVVCRLPRGDAAADELPPRITSDLPPIFRGELFRVILDEVVGMVEYERVADFSPASDRVAVVAGRAVSIFAVPTTELLLTTALPTHDATGHSDFITSVAFSPNGAAIATTSRDATVRLWCAHTGSQLHVLRGASGGVDSVSFVSELALCSISGRDLTMWRIDPQRELPVGGGVPFTALVNQRTGYVMQCGGASRCVGGRAKRLERFDGAHCMWRSGHAAVFEACAAATVEQAELLVCGATSSDADVFHDAAPQGEAAPAEIARSPVLFATLARLETVADLEQARRVTAAEAPSVQRFVMSAAASIEPGVSQALVKERKCAVERSTKAMRRTRLLLDMALTDDEAPAPFHAENMQRYAAVSPGAAVVYERLCGRQNDEGSIEALRMRGTPDAIDATLLLEHE
jgi:WD40 repeat protein